MISVVDLLVAIEEKAKRGEELSKQEVKSLKVGTSLRNVPSSG